MLKTHPPGPSAFARARSISIACLRDSTPSKRSSCSQVFPARSRCMWLSISPGMTALPRRSIRLVLGPASRAISWLVPTADDAVAADGHRLRDREALVDRDDFPVRQDQIGRRLRGWLARASSLPRRRTRATHRRPRCFVGQACHGGSSFTADAPWSRMIFIRGPLSEPSRPIAAFASSRGMTLLTSGSSLTCPLSTSAMAAG